MTSDKSHDTHILPLKVYLGVAAALLFLTAVTVAVSYVDFGPFNMVIAMGIAATKATLVALIFMHLFYDDKLYLTIFIMSILMLAIFIVITLFDTLRRGDIYEQVGKPYKQDAQIYQTAPADSGAAGHGVEAAGDTTVSDSGSSHSENSGH
ncbi:MAG: cytochrome C oxidase subunit IV family protein [Candidatus Marinimicrobia bacterium]|nr:cytochrome C oxidase subunit IV family protein [Candidatus Neomarinimicrobiota bacterium]MCF7829784.1 cytochrome C oxidase subunit IV family protein [Candidatus Neomarinimicrobiota bacterium]MCF7881783.1 cytochrome C oxidase subunit IV family protein [Candidatus Neomarinimicrobiota bacterium]